MDTAAEHRKAEHTVFEEIWNRGRIELVPSFYAANWKAHDAGLPTIEARIRNFREAMPDMHYTVHEVIAEGDRVAVRWTLRATHLGPLFGIPATGKRLEVTGMIIDRFEAGKIVEHWSAWDRLDFMQQLGLAPKPGA